MTQHYNPFSFKHEGKAVRETCGLYQHFCFCLWSTADTVEFSLEGSVLKSHKEGVKV